MTPDSRIEAAAQWLAASRGDRWRDSTMRQTWRTEAADLLRDIDDADPLRAPDVIHSIGGANRATERAPVAQGGNYVHNTPERKRVWPDD